MPRKRYSEEHEQSGWDKRTQGGQDSDTDTEAAEVSDDLATLLADIEKLRADAQESHSRYLRALADFDNFRKRQREDTSLQIDQATDRLLVGLLPIVDSFERALEAAKSKRSFDALVEGVELTLKQMRDLLAREGVEEVDAVGSLFDPTLHDAMMRVETDDYPENTVVAEFEKGYTHNGRPLRTAKVQVAAPSS